MARMFCIPGVALLTIAFILSVLITISLPTVHNFDIVRLRFNVAQSSAGETGIDSVRWGIWGFCYEQAGKTSFQCTHTGLTYEVLLGSTSGGVTQGVGGSYTRGLVLHPISLAVTFVALLLSFSEHLVVTLIASLASFLAAVITLVAFAIDIALYARVRKQANDLKDVKANTDFGPAFWMTLAQLILLLLAGCTVCFGRRHAARESRGGGNSYPMLEKRPWYKRMGRRA